MVIVMENNFLFILINKNLLINMIKNVQLNIKLCIYYSFIKLILIK